MRQSHVSSCVLCSSTVEDKRRKQLAREDGRGEGEQQEKGERQVTANVFHIYNKTQMWQSWVEIIPFAYISITFMLYHRTSCEGEAHGAV